MSHEGSLSHRRRKSEKLCLSVLISVIASCQLDNSCSGCSGCPGVLTPGFCLASQVTGVPRLASLACGWPPGAQLIFRNLPLLAIAVNTYSFFGNKVSDRPSNSGFCPVVLLMGKAFPRPITPLSGCHFLRGKVGGFD